ncbi:MAG: DUF6514 family protein [Oscillospiraceae bacterium]|nr:DUF6514 family protein [Oscillospiraceae bacterium]
MQKELYKIAVARNFRMEYHILESVIEHEGGEVRVFGVEIVKKQRKNGVLAVEVEAVENVCITRERICDFIITLANNLVTPVTLRDIVEDMIAVGQLATAEERLILDEMAQVV